MTTRMSAAPLVLAGFGMSALAAFLMPTATLAQTQPPAQKQPAAKQKTPAPAQKQAPAPMQPTQQDPAQAPAGGDQAVQQAAAIPTPWTKLCNKEPQQDNKEICLVTQEIRAETGQFLASVMVREVAGDPKKQFVIAVPPGMLLQPGMRVIVDQGNPVAARYAVCFPNACFGDAEITPDFIASMKKGQSLTVQTINQVGRTVNFTLGLKDFAKAYDGPPIDPKAVEEQQKKLQEELQKRADEQRKRLEGQGGGAPAGGGTTQPTPR